MAKRTYLKRSLEERLNEYIVKTKDCWIWQGSPRPDGYGQLHLNGTTKLAHRVVYEYYRNPISKELELDHLCRIRMCVNPEHLEPVTHQENSRRGIAGLMTQIRQQHYIKCPRGHLYGEKRGSKGERLCLVCRNLKQRQRYWKTKKQGPIICDLCGKIFKTSWGSLKLHKRFIHKFKIEERAHEHMKQEYDIRGGVRGKYYKKYDVETDPKYQEYKDAVKENLLK